MTSDMKFSIEESSSDEDNGGNGTHGQSNRKDNRTNAMYSTSFPQIDNNKKKNSKENSKNKNGVLGGLFNSKINNGKNTKITQSRNGENTEYCQVGNQSDESDNDNINIPVKNKKKNGIEKGKERGRGSDREEDRDNSVNPFNRIR